MCLWLFATVAAYANRVSSITVDDAVITVNVPVDVVGADAALVARWAQAIDRLWNRGNDGQPFGVCGRDFQVNAQFVLHASAQPSRTSHFVMVQPVRPGQSFVSTVWHALGSSPSYSPRTGYWGTNLDGDTAAHEFGHLLGLLDEYIESDSNANGSREPGERPRPDVSRYQDAPFSLMASDAGVVLRRHILEVLRVHGAERWGDCQELRTKN